MRYPHAQPDWVYTIRLYADTGLNDEGWDRLATALDDVGIEDLVAETVHDAIQKALPHRPREYDGPTWFCEVHCVEEAFGATICPDLTLHTAPAITSAVEPAQERTEGLRRLVEDARRLIEGADDGVGLHRHGDAWLARARAVLAGAP